MLMTPAGQLAAQVVGEDLHVAGEHHEVDLVLGHQPQQLGLRLRLGVAGDGDVDEGDAVPLRDRRQVGVVGDDQRDVDGQFTQTPAVEQVDQAVVELRHHQQHPAALLLGPDGQNRVETGQPQREFVPQPLGVGRRVSPGSHGW